MFDQFFKTAPWTLGNDANGNVIPGIAAPMGAQYMIGTYSVDRCKGVCKCEMTDPDAEGKREVVKNLPVCSKAIVPTAIFDNSDDMVQKVEVSFWDRGKWRTSIVPRSTLTNKNKVAQLADLGWPIGTDNAGYVAKYFLSVLSENDEKLPRRALSSCMGWIETDTGKKFMPYTDEIAFDGEDAYSHLYKAISERGNIDEWADFMRKIRSENTADPGAKTNMTIRMMMAASFASPLIELIDQNPFVAFLFSPTGNGKTVSLMVAASIWGDPGRGRMIRSLNMTMNSMLSTAAFLNDLPFFGDELQTLKSRWNKSYDQIVMQLCEGIDRGRMQNSTLLRTKTWRCAFIFNGEDPIIKESSGGGTVNRVVQIEAEGVIVKGGNAIVNFVKKNYGTAGKLWVEFLNKTDDLQDKYNDLYQSVMALGITTEKQAGAMAILLLADRLASGLFWPGEYQLTLDDIKPYLAAANKVDISARAWDFIVNAIAENAANFEKEARVQWGRRDGETVWINKSVLTRLLTDAGYDFDAIKKRWSHDDHIGLNRLGKYAWYTSSGGASAYYVKLKVPEARDDGSGQVEMTELTEQQKDELPF